MFRTALVSAALAAFSLAVAAPSAAARAVQAPAPATAAEAAPFLGDWTLALQGPDGPGTFDLSLKTENERVVGDIGSEAVAEQKITSATKAGKGLALGYSFPWEAMTVDAVITLTPAADGRMAAQIDFAGGGYTMTGTATKKEKSK